MAAAADPENIVENFKEVCAVDEVKAREFLAHCDNNLERAVQLYFQTGGTLENTHESVQNTRNTEEEALRRRRPGSSSASSSSSTDSTATPARPRDAVGVRQMSWLEWLITVAYLPFRLVIATVYDLFGTISTLFGFSPQPTVTDPRGDVRRFIESYEAHIAPQAEMPIGFMDMPFNDATRRAKETARVLLVILHDEVSAESRSFLRDSLSSTLLGHFIHSSNILVWGASKTSGEGARVAHMLKTRVFPFVTLLVPRNGQLQPAVRILGSTDSQNLLVNLQMTVLAHEDHMQQIREQRRQREEDTRIREEQEREYQAALVADRAKVEEKKRKAEEEKRRQQGEKDRESALKECVLRLQQEKERVKRECDAKPKAEGETVKVQIRFPSGHKHENNFSMDESVESLFNAALTQSACPDLFSLFTNYPRRQLHAAPSWYTEWRSLFLSLQSPPPPSPEAPPTPRSFRDEGFSRSVVVMVQDDNS